MSRRARFLIVLGIAVLVSVIYLWFFGFQTVIALGVRQLARKTPLVGMAPAQLTDLSISRSPGRKLSYFGYEFEVPWNDMDEAKSSIIADNKAMIAFQSGNSLSVWHGSPRAFVNSVLSNDKIDPSTLRRMYGDEALQSDYALYRTLLETTPDKFTPFISQTNAASRAILLIVKGTILPRGTESGIFAVNAGEFSGFQFGRPANPSGGLSVRLFSNISSLNFIFSQRRAARPSSHSRTSTAFCAPCTGPHPRSLQTRNYQSSEKCPVSRGRRLRDSSSPHLASGLKA